MLRKTNPNTHPEERFKKKETEEIQQEQYSFLKERKKFLEEQHEKELIASKQSKLKRQNRIRLQKEILEMVRNNLLNPEIKNRLIVWENDKNNIDSVYEGYVDDELFFLIERGFINFRLKIKNENLIELLKKENKVSFNLMTSFDIFNLQKKAEKILKENLLNN